MSTGGIEEQTKLVMDNLTAVLAANGMTMANVVSTTVHMKI
jgi:2-iminobutanoate/2-iminopropanoate deaminase